MAMLMILADTVVYRTADAGDTRNIIRFLLLLLAIWAVVAIIWWIIPVPDIGKKIIAGVAAVASLLLALSFFGLI